jgi:hypothetical protein
MSLSPSTTKVAYSHHTMPLLLRLPMSIYVRWSIPNHGGRRRWCSKGPHSFVEKAVIVAHRPLHTMWCPFTRSVTRYTLVRPKTHQSAHRMPKETLASWINLRKKPHLQTTTMKMCSSTQSVPPHTPKGQVKNTEEETEQVLVVIKCIYLPPTYLHFIQDIEDRCLLITSFVDLPFQEHRMMEKHHMDQNPCISSLCPK